MGNNQCAPLMRTEFDLESIGSRYYNSKCNELFRPATADSRFRFWKTWLVEKIEADGKEPEEVKEKRAQRRHQNEAAFKVSTTLQCRYRRHPKDGESNVLTGVHLSTPSTGGTPVSGPRSIPNLCSHVLSEVVPQSLVPCPFWAVPQSLVQGPFWGPSLVPCLFQRYYSQDRVPPGWDWQTPSTQLGLGYPLTGTGVPPPAWD